MNVDVKMIKKILKIMEENDLAEFILTQKDESISLKKKESRILADTAFVANQNEVVSDSSNQKGDKKESYEEITSPIVGTFYSSPSPDSLPFLHKGKSFEKGETLCILEAMKLMNEFKSEFSGTIVDILVKDGESVEYGQPLFLIER